MGLIAHYLRGFFRSNMKPVAPRVATKWHNLSTVVYNLAAWSSLGAVMWYYFATDTHNSENPYKKGKLFTPYDAISKFGAAEGNTIVRISGWNKVEREVVSMDEAIEKKNQDKML